MSSTVEEAVEAAAKESFDPPNDATEGGDVPEASANYDDEQQPNPPPPHAPGYAQQPPEGTTGFQGPYYPHPYPYFNPAFYYQHNAPTWPPPAEGYPPIFPPVNPNDYQAFLAWQQHHQQQEQPKKAEETEVEEETKEADNASKKKKKKNESDAVAKPLMSLQNESDENATLETPWADLVEGCELVCPALRGDIPDALFVSIGQFKPCGLTQDDRVGKYKNREIGFVGMCCKHCGGQPGFGRYFPGSYDSFLNGTNCEGIVKHIKSECRSCPPRVRSTVLDLETQHDSTNRPRYGSRKRFFSFVWTKLRNTKLPERHEIGKITDLNKDEGMTIDHILENCQVVSIKDRHLVSDTTLVAMAQMKICAVTEEDKIGRCKDHYVGFKGLCCKHCGGKAGKPGFGRYFPSSLRSLAQADSCQQIIKHITSKCTKCPSEVRSLIIEMHLLEKQERIRYGSRKIFFRRVWERLHGANSETAPNDAAPPEDDSDNEDIDWDRIIGESRVVSIQDKGLISDAQLAAIAQMDLCKLTAADRVGWFKDRDIGFGGLCCKHCGGRPSFGRYFPNSVRSFAQTTSSQTIISHVAMYCQQCPQDIRDIILKLQKRENSNEGTLNSDKTMYGSRKVFFDRVWKRMHNTTGTPKDETKEESTEDGTEESKKRAREEERPPSPQDGEQPPMEQSEATEEDEDPEAKRIKQGVEETLTATI